MKKITKILTSSLLCATMSFSLFACSKENGKTEKAGTAKTAPKAVEKIITLDSETIYGEQITNEYFKENDLTIVNIMATWCGPCVREMPELQAINAADNGFGVVGVVVDTIDEITGLKKDSAAAEAAEIAAATGVKYPLVIPTQTFMEQTLNKTAALLPMSFIVNSNGKIVKGPIAGAKDMNGWLNILNKVKEAL